MTRRNISRGTRQPALRAMLAMLALMALWAMPTLAAWTPVGHVDAGMSHYFEPVLDGSGGGDIRRVWRLASQVKTEQAEAMSNRAVWDVDCARAQARIVQMWWFQEPMAQGLSLDVTFRTDTQWHPVAPGSQSQAVMAAVCRR